MRSIGKDGLHRGGRLPNDTGGPRAVQQLPREMQNGMVEEKPEGLTMVLQVRWHMPRSGFQLAQAAVVFLLSIQNALANDPAGAVEDLEGTATAVAGETSRPLHSGAEVFIGDNLKTGPASIAVLQLGKRTKLKLGAQANIRIDRYLADAGGEIDLLSGGIFFERTGKPASDILGVKSAYGLIAVRGTRFFAGPSNGKFGVFVEHGRVDVTAGGTTVSVGARQGTDIAAPGQAPSPPASWKTSRIHAIKELFKRQ